ncbi:serine/threonine-protein kinase PknG [Parafrankia irregularis]|uniref:non-specific serine/threonine protein kinase n=1 Tax=Parafrankia irregularis TaxID=795642 RepID=A0A0S4QPI1_9ACTN|nr:MULTISPECIES: serine/threonine protein kinase [Parafrankia]MBE3205992.1 serine/threonine protein kinase [Parafrankia sp. CH37]CUU57129.1 serine/threonine-protein kinase PknG [Parafrankia irregularis]
MSNEPSGVACVRPRCNGKGIIGPRGRCTVCGHPPERQRETRGDRPPPHERWEAPIDRTRPPSVANDSASGPPPVISDERVPPDDWRCEGCGHSLGAAAVADGRCPGCGHPLSPAPSTLALRTDDLVEGRYRILGRMARGGQGWIYAAKDERSGIWVVLKGLLDTGDTRARIAAERERVFLTAVEHPDIVRIRDFVTHNGAEYIVMDYVRGDSLEKMRRDQNGRLDPADATRHVQQLLPALRYLHERGLVYCDLKPENVMVRSDAITLIDLGGARRADDLVSPYLSTPGFRAPEIDDAHASGGTGSAPRAYPSVASDIYAVGRTLAVLLLGTGWGLTGEHRHSLPARDEHQVFRDHESLHRLLLRATEQDPAARFTDIAELEHEVLGVTHEILARQGSRRKIDRALPPPLSRRFTPMPYLTGEDDDPPPDAILPSPQVDPDDPAAAALAAIPADGDPSTIARMLAELTPMTAEVQLRRVRFELDAGRPGKARDLLEKIARDGGARGGLNDPSRPAGWRVDWYRGLVALAEGKPADAAEPFDRVFSAVPGELAPRLALAVAYERAGDHDRAAEYYDVVSVADRSAIGAAFGLARCRSKPTDRIAAYARVPETSRFHPEARARMVEALVASLTAELDTSTPRDRSMELAEERLDRACRLLRNGEREMTAPRRLGLRLRIFRVASALLAAGALPATGTVLGHPCDPDSLRLAVEKTLLELASHTEDRRTRVRLVDEATRIRRWTWY